MAKLNSGQRVQLVTGMVEHFLTMRGINSLALRNTSEVAKHLVLADSVEETCRYLDGALAAYNTVGVKTDETLDDAEFFFTVVQAVRD